MSAVDFGTSSRSFNGTALQLDHQLRIKAFVGLAGVSSTTQPGLSSAAVHFAKRPNNRRRALARTSGAEMPQGQKSPTTSPAWRKWMAELSRCLVNLTESNSRTVWSYKIAGTAAP